MNGKIMYMEMLIEYLSNIDPDNKALTQIYYSIDEQINTLCIAISKL